MWIHMVDSNLFGTEFSCCCCCCWPFIFNLEILVENSIFSVVSQKLLDDEMSRVAISYLVKEWLIG